MFNNFGYNKNRKKKKEGKEVGPERVDQREWTREVGPERLDQREWTRESGPERVDQRAWTRVGQVGSQTVGIELRETESGPEKEIREGSRSWIREGKEKVDQIGERE